MSNNTASLVKNDELQFQYDNEDCGEVPTIEEEDLADVRSDIDLCSVGAVSIAADLELQSIAVPDNVCISESDSAYSDGENVDDDIVMDVLDSASIRRKQLAYESRRKSCFASALFVTLVVGLSLAIIIPASQKYEKSEIDEINSRLDDQGSAYGFDEKDEFGPIDSSSNDRSTNMLPPLINETQLKLLVPFPEAISNNLLDLNDGVFDHESELPFFWQIPLSGSSVQSIMTGCLGLILASGMGDRQNTRPEVRLIKFSIDTSNNSFSSMSHATVHFNFLRVLKLYK
jgi:hypothetical protein